MFLKQFIISLFMCALPLHSAYAKVVTRSVKPKSIVQKIQSYKDVAHILHDAQPDWLIIFDVDETLIKKDGFVTTQPKHAVHWLKTNRPLQGNHIDVKLARYRYTHIDENIQALVQGLWAKKLKPIALTHCRSGEHGVIKSSKEWRYHHLRVLGLDFKKSYNQTISLTNNGKVAPLFYNGIIYTNHYEKGYCLERFLDHTGMQPKQIVFFDDLIQNIESVRDSALKYGIDFIGYHVAIIKE